MINGIIVQPSYDCTKDCVWEVLNQYSYFNLSLILFSIGTMAPKSRKKMQDEWLYKKVAKERVPKDIYLTLMSELVDSSSSEV